MRLVDTGVPQYRRLHLGVTQMKSDWIWMDGEWLPFAEAKVHVLAHTLHYGLGAFEGIRAYAQPDGKPGVWRLEEHLERLLHSLKMARLDCPYSLEDLHEVCLEVLDRNEFDAAYLRPIAFLGAGALGLGARNNPLHVAVAAWQWGAYMGEEGIAKGVRLRTSSFTRNHPNAALGRAKIVGHYVNSILARYEANDDGFDEALMLDHRGFVAEGTGENVFVVQNGVVYTPQPNNILPGITRASVLEICAAEGIPTTEQPLTRDAFYVADEAFMCGTAAEVTPIASLDRREIGTGSPGPITQRLQALYKKAVAGEDERFQHHISRRG